MCTWGVPRHGVRLPLFRRTKPLVMAIESPTAGGVLLPGNHQGVFTLCAVVRYHDQTGP